MRLVREAPTGKFRPGSFGPLLRQADQGSPLQNLQRRGELLLGDRQRRHELRHSPFRPAGEEEDAARPGVEHPPLRDLGRRGAGPPRGAPGRGPPRRRGSAPARWRGAGRGCSPRRAARAARSSSSQDVERRRGRRRRRAGWRGRWRCGAPRPGSPSSGRARGGRSPRRSAGRRPAPCRSRGGPAAPPRARRRRAAPVRPKPVKISSAISSAPRCRQISGEPGEPAGGRDQHPLAADDRLDDHGADVACRQDLLHPRQDRRRRGAAGRARGGGRRRARGTPPAR